MGQVVRYIYTADEYQRLERERDELEARVKEMSERLDRRRSPLGRLLWALIGR